MEKEKDRIMDGSKPSEWAGTTVKQVRLIIGRDLPRLESDMNQELLALTLAHNQIENIRTYTVAELNRVRYVGEITYSTPYMKVPKEDTPENKKINNPKEDITWNKNKI